MQKYTSKKGFTLVEIMIVVVIIGLLAAMAIPAFNRVRATSRGNAMDNDARQLGGAAEQYFMETGLATVAVTYDSTTGIITGALAPYVNKLGAGYTGSGITTLTPGTDFTLVHAQVESGGTVTYTAEGHRKSVTPAP